MGIYFVNASQKSSSHFFVRAAFFVRGDSNPERVSGVEKTCLRHVFSCEVRSSFAARTGSARQNRCAAIPPGGPVESLERQVRSRAFFLLLFSARICSGYLFFNASHANRGRNLELKNETTKFRSLFYSTNPVFMLFFKIILFC